MQHIRVLDIQIKVPTVVNSHQEEKNQESNKTEETRKKSFKINETNMRNLTYLALNKDKWKNQIEFFLSCLGYAVGLGNIWRFPYLCMAYGGGAFLVPYFTFLFVSGIPLYFAELVIGQYTGLSPVRVFDFAPIFIGLGWSMMIISGILCIYYNLLMAWICFYFFSSFKWTLPWSSCFNSWNTDNCRELVVVNQNSSILGWSYKPGVELYTIPVYRGTKKYANWTVSSSSSEEFWYHNVLQITETPMDLGDMNWPLFGCLVLAWTITALCLLNGIKSSGKVVYVTSLAPYLFLLIILIRGCLLPGSLQGIKFYIIPDWSRLKDPKIWMAAAVQIFYSLGPCWGGLITMASYNKFHHNCYRDALLLPILSCGTSFFGGFAIFSILGYMTHLVGSDNFQNVIKAGPGLAFIAYPEVLSHLPGGAIWSVLFFLMLFTLGLDSQFATLETMTSGLIERFPRTIGGYKKTFVLSVCLIECLLGIPFVTKGGFYLFTILDTYSTSFSVLFVGLFEAIAFAYFYDGKRIIKHTRKMVGKYLDFLRYYWYMAWYSLVPITMIMVIVTTCSTYEPPIAPNGQRYPDWSVNIGWATASIAISFMPLMALRVCWESRKNLKMVVKPSKIFQTWMEMRNAELRLSDEVEIESNNKLKNLKSDKI